MENYGLPAAALTFALQLVCMLIGVPPYKDLVLHVVMFTSKIGPPLPPAGKKPPPCNWAHVGAVAAAGGDPQGSPPELLV